MLKLKKNLMILVGQKLEANQAVYKEHLQLYNEKLQKNMRASMPNRGLEPR